MWRLALKVLAAGTGEKFAGALAEVAVAADTETLQFGTPIHIYDRQVIAGTVQ